MFGDYGIHVRRQGMIIRAAEGLPPGRPEMRHVGDRIVSEILDGRALSDFPPGEQATAQAVLALLADSKFIGMTWEHYGLGPEDWLRVGPWTPQPASVWLRDADEPWLTTVGRVIEQKQRERDRGAQRLTVARAALAEAEARGERGHDQRADVHQTEYALKSVDRDLAVLQRHLETAGPNPSTVQGARSV